MYEVNYNILFSPYSIHIFSSGVGECSKLEELSLSRNCLQSFTGLHHCTSLTKIDLSYNSINTLADISSLTSLRVCSMDVEWGEEVKQFLFWHVTVVLKFDWSMLQENWLIALTCQENLFHLPKIHIYSLHPLKTYFV